MQINLHKSKPIRPAFEEEDVLAKVDARSQDQYLTLTRPVERGCAD
jgi:hypothetical protein